MAAPLSFQHLAPELRLHAGPNSLASLARELQRADCQRAVIVSGRSAAQGAGMQALRDALGARLAGECHSVRANSPLPAIQDTARVLEALQADAVVAVGGGSAAVTARAASILLAEKRPAPALCTRRLADGTFSSPRLDAPKLPQFGVLTTPSTAFAKAGSAVVDPDSGERLALFDPKTRARALFLHPAFLDSAPADLVQSASLNTLSTAIEALESPRCDPVSEGMLLQALRLTVRHIKGLGETPSAAREMLAIAAILCGRGTDQSGGGLASVLAHAIGHRVDVANGVVNAIVLPHTLRFNATATLDTAGRIAAGLLAEPVMQTMEPSNAAHLAAQRLEALFAALTVPRRLRDVGVKHTDLTAIAQAAMADWFIGRVPRCVQVPGDVLTLLESAW